MKKRVFIMLLDSFGIGHAHDADKYGDKGSDTLGHIAQFFADGKTTNGQTSLKLPNLTKLGLLEAYKHSTGHYPANMDASLVDPQASYCYAQEVSNGKDTPSGHWEIAGCPVKFDWTYFPEHTNSFPTEFLDNIVKKAGLPGYLGNCHASGTVILDQLGEEHMKTGKPIFYTSADSVFQIAAHEETFGVEKLLQLCELVREELNQHFEAVGRVIARPFVGDKAGSFSRTGNRRDYSILPPSETVLVQLEKNGGQVVSVGKIADIYAHQGITKKVKATGLEELFDKSIIEIKEAKDNTIVFTNFVNFDSDFGHRRDPQGYGEALEYFDSRVPELLSLLEEGDLIIFTADHGNDPTWPGTEHTREHIPVLFAGPGAVPGYHGKRETFSDIGATIAKYLNLPGFDFGKSIF
ncbi:phosphopentomutase [Psittacicella gerlachiana]|uniref:Phosphopentomutase n=1 Tax=Psittacicella gerlachiana TaxID=2028574 RepID=A0A3A1YMK6_9GAMM|nr:phosphopentomutase [Psittacicella gerlachiana]RIY38686.1 phosphopentomutase [Psittacicella gerlachiana]